MHLMRAGFDYIWPHRHELDRFGVELAVLGEPHINSGGAIVDRYDILMKQFGCVPL